MGLVDVCRLEIFLLIIFAISKTEKINITSLKVFFSLHRVSMIHFEVWIKCVVLNYFLISELRPFDLAGGAADRGEPALHFLNCSRRPLHLPQNSVVLCVYTKATQPELLAGFDRVLSVENAC
jgi:hypothetical protein